MEIFENSFESVPHINLFSPRDLDDHIKVIKLVIGDKDMGWEKRVDAVGFILIFSIILLLYIILACLQNKYKIILVLIY